MSRTAPAAGYAALVRQPHAGVAFAFSLVGRLSYSTVSLALLLSVQTATGSYAAAGLAVAAFGATAGLLAPLRARQAQEVLYTIGPMISGLIAASSNPLWALVATAALLAVGSGGMSLSPLCRTWSVGGADPATKGSSPLRQRDFRAVVLVMLGLGTALGIVHLAVVAFAQQHDRAAAAGAAGAGILVDHAGVPAAFFVAAGALGVVTLRASSAIRRRPAGDGVDGDDVRVVLGAGP